MYIGYAQKHNFRIIYINGVFYCTEIIIDDFF